ncbi:MAG: heme-binding domain-containing protein [Lutibacter sp.]
MPSTRNQSNEILETDFSKTLYIPNNVQCLLKNSCYDCHSNFTNYPWYNKIQPVSWFLEYHIEEGKKELNFSEFGGYSTRRQKNKLKSIKSQIEKDKMPFLYYSLVHRDTKLSKKDKKLIYNWLYKLKIIF